MSDRTIPADGIGMHLYTMREPLAEDYPGTLQATGRRSATGPSG